MTRWSFTTTDASGKTETATVKRDDAIVKGLAQAYGGNAQVTTDGQGNITQATIKHSGGTSTYTRS